MFDEDKITQLVKRLRKIGKDTQDCEVKEAAGEVPNSLLETISAFANGQGGTILLGLSERNGFTFVNGFDATKAQDALISLGKKLSPIIRPSTEIVSFEGNNILAAFIEPLPLEEKPCYVFSKGKYNGSFIRSCDGDRQFTRYEIDRLLEFSRQPQWDARIVEDAIMEDLDNKLVQALVQRQREIHPRVFERMGEEKLLSNMRVIVADEEGKLRPTLAGLLALGVYPQKYFPRLVVTFARYLGKRNEKAALFEGLRFLDSRTLVGPIPVMIADAVECVRKNMRIGAKIEGAFRKDVPDYPLAAVREAVANSLQHRDYSAQGNASPVVLNMYDDCLEVINPGGLYGRMTVEDLGKPGKTASRNAFLSAILEATPYGSEGFVVENRGSGLVSINNELEKDGLQPARFHSKLSSFTIEFWGREIQALTKKNLSGSQMVDMILEMLVKQDSVSVREVVDATGFSRSSVTSNLRKLQQAGTIEATENRNNPRQRYRLTEK